jgi:small subunit ribosomal protein S18
MARNNDRDRDRGSKRVLKDNRPKGKTKVCIFCKEHAVWVDYKDINLLRRFMSDRGKIRSRRVTGNCAQHQRDAQVAIKTAREVALLPYHQRTVGERGLGRGPRGPRSEERGESRSSAEAGEDVEAEDLASDGADDADQDTRDEVDELVGSEV